MKEAPLHMSVSISVCRVELNFLSLQNFENWNEEESPSVYTERRTGSLNIFKKTGAECHPVVVKRGTWRSVGQCFLKENHFLPRILHGDHQRKKIVLEKNNTLSHMKVF